jgi:6-phosphogluconate dehydrogenase (decarboxylating)
MKEEKKVANQKVEELVNKVSQVLVDSIHKDLEQYESEKELWNTEVQSQIADRIANKINTLISNTDWIVTTSKDERDNQDEIQ